MTRTRGVVLILGVLTTFAPMSRGQAPAPDLLPPPGPAVEAAPLPPPRPLPPPGSHLTAPVPPPLPGPVLPRPYTPHPDPYAPYQDYNGPLLRSDPLLDRPEAPPPGFFSAVELSLLVPHIKNRLRANLMVDGFYPNTVHLPTADLDWAASPRVELGYRLPQGLGEMLASYRFLVTEGDATLLFFDLDNSDGFLHSRLNLNVFDVDYGSREFSLDPHWDMKWKVGARLASIFFDSQAAGFALEQRTSNSFWGVGPHAGLDLWRRLDVPGLALFGRVEGATTLGHVQQAFGESVLFDDGSVRGAAVTARHLQMVPILSLQAGLGWSTSWHTRCLRLATGYEFESWWYVGEAGDSGAELMTQGFFLRAEVGF